MDVPEAEICSDYARIMQVLANVLSNAVKFTPAGGTVSVQAWLEYTATEFALLHAYIIDTGIGMTEEQLAHLIRCLAQPTLRAGGAYSGLGLAISKRLLDAMGGVLEFSSKKDGGTRVHVSFRVQRHRTDDVEAVSPSELLRDPQLQSTKKPRLSKPLHVLLVDNNAQNREMLERYLTSFGCTHESAAAGQPLLDLFRQQPSRFDAILVDVKTGGLELTRQIREIERFDGRKPALIIGLYGDARPSQRTAALTALGINNYLTKPYQRDELFQKLSNRNI